MNIYELGWKQADATHVVVVHDADVTWRTASGGRKDVERVSFGSRNSTSVEDLEELVHTEWVLSGHVDGQALAAAK